MSAAIQLDAGCRHHPRTRTSATPQPAAAAANTKGPQARTGIKAVRDTCERAAAFKATARKMGVKVTGQYWTSGASTA
jgi:hypothetical protein